MGRAGNLTINGKDAWTTWGITMADKGLSALMTPPGMKANIKNASRRMDGTVVIRGNARKEARSVTVTLQFSAKTREEFFRRYASFCEELATGFLDIVTGYQPTVKYRMEYNKCTQFSEFYMGAAKYTLQLTENDPSDRAI